MCYSASMINSVCGFVTQLERNICFKAHEHWMLCTLIYHTLLGKEKVKM